MNLRRAVQPTPFLPMQPGPIAIGAVVWLLCYVIWVSLTGPFDAAWQLVVDGAAMLPFRVAVAVLAFGLARAPGVPPRAVLGWRLLGASFVVAALANLLGLLIPVTGGVRLPSDVRLMFAVPQAALMLSGLWYLARVRPESGSAADWLDAGVIVLSAFLLASYFLSSGNPFSSTHQGATRALFLLYLLADIAAVLFTATAWFRRPHGVARHALGLLTLGFGLVAAIDLQYDREIQAGTWIDGGVIDLLVALAFVLIILGLDVQRQQRAVVEREPRPMRHGRHTVAPIAIGAATLPLLYEVWSPSPDLRELPFLVTCVAVLLALVLMRQHIARADARAAAQARAAADSRFRSLVQRSSDAIFQLSGDHVIAWASPSAGGMTGSIPAMLEGRRLVELAHPEDRDRLTVFLANAGEPFSRNAVLRWRLGRANTWHEVESVVSDLTGEAALGAGSPAGVGGSGGMGGIGSASGAVRGLVLNTRDVSERVQLEAQLRQAQKLEAVGRLAGGIAHDFNNILAAIITHAQLVRDDLPASHQSASDLLEIEQTAQRGAVLTRRLLSFSRPEAGELRAQELSGVVRGMEPMLRRLLVGQVELQLDLAESDLWVRTAEGQLEQILMNLAINARDAMANGGVVNVRTRATIVRPGEQSSTRGAHMGRWAELVVRDEGIGMDEGTLARIFEPFFTTKPTGLGTGLGLATVRGIVRALGGHASAESSLGKGATLRVLLPLVAPAAEEPVVEEAPQEGPSAGRPRVLVVDDEITLRRAMERYLARHNYDVLGAPSAVDALSLLEEHEWAVDLVVTDMVMPRMGGREFVRRIRARTPGMPVLCISGHMEWGEPDDQSPDSPWSRERLLTKPFPFPAFLQRVRETLGASAASAKP